MNASELAELCDGTGNNTTVAADRVTSPSGSIVTVSGWQGVTLATLQVGVMLVGLLGNTTVAASVWRQGTSRQNQQQPAAHRHALLLSLAMADLLVTLLCLPAALARLLVLPWAAHWVMCPLLAATQNTAHAASTLSIAFLALDRYLTVRWPKLAPRVASRTAQLLAGLWVMAVLLAVPRGLTAALAVPGPICSEHWPVPALRVLYHTTVAAVVHLLPCATVILCHAAVASSLRRRGLDDTRMNLRPRQVIIMARECSLGGANTHKIVAASSSGGESDGDEERAALELRDPNNMPQVTLDAGKGRAPQAPPRPAPAIKPARNIHTIIRAHRRMRVRGPAQTASIFTSYRGHSTETRRRLARMLVALGAVFAACWLPYVVALLIWAWRESPATRYALEVTLVLGHAHSALNPVVYWLMNRAFLTSLQRLLSTQLRLPRGMSCGGCGRPSCLSRPAATPWAGNSSTNEDNLGAFHPKYLNPHALRPQASRCTSHYFH
ncbi:orexin/Hypocretin receptor type 1-like [Scylla paramamosain]|uniref:orexin/Hypocretin receptor type 1-like n=1 Tax=Scylla paramamosain TaxID=85552 RepID=UPI003082AF87